MTAVNQLDPQIHRRLQQDSILLSGKTIFINPFLYWRRFDSNTDRWLREPGQLTEEQITINRNRFYPELDWDFMDEEERAIKDGSIEMFLKSLELIGTFHPELTAGQLLEVERKMAVTKKLAFERWVQKSFRKRYRQESSERKRFQRERFWRSWIEWSSNETTHQAIVPIVAIVFLSGFGGWSLGMSNVSCPSFLTPSQETSLN